MRSQPIKCWFSSKDSFESAKDLCTPRHRCIYTHQRSRTKFQQFGFLHRRTSILSTGRSQPIIKPFDNGWLFIHYLIDKFIYLILHWLSITSSYCINAVQVLIQHVYDIASDILPVWEFTPRIHWVKKRSKSSHGAGKFSIKLRASKNPSYNNRNCKSGQHNRRHSFTRHVPWKIRADMRSQTVLCTNFKVNTTEE